MAYLLVTWEEDNSVSVINSKAKGIVSVDGTKIKFRWPRKGIYDGIITDSSGMAVQYSISKIAKICLNNRFKERNGIKGQDFSR